ncbi:MAG: hypothetical protein ACR2GJ_06980 [Gemmatimonadaceae bacterium]
MATKRSITAMRRPLRGQLLAVLGLAAMTASTGISACHDTLPVAPTQIVPAEASLSAVPTDDQYAQMAPEFRTDPTIFGYWTKVGFVGRQGYARAWMQYWANYASITLPLTLLYNNSVVTTTTGYTELTSLLPATREMEAHAAVGINGSCGHTLNATGIFKIHHQAPIGKGWFKFLEATVSDAVTTSQPPCACSGSTGIKHDAYDPYASYPGGSDCESGGGAGSGGGGGTQYQPGDYTGGETVGWSTGIGNGGWSACGSDARVEYICIDVWNASTERWEEWSCGYATTCGYVT